MSCKVLGFVGACPGCGARLQSDRRCVDCGRELRRWDFAEYEESFAERSSPEGRALGRKIRRMRELLAAHDVPDWDDAAEWVRIWEDPESVPLERSTWQVVEDIDDALECADLWLQAGWRDVGTVRDACEVRGLLRDGFTEDALDWLSGFPDLTDAQLAPFHPITMAMVEEHRRAFADAPEPAGHLFSKAEARALELLRNGAHELLGFLGSWDRTTRAAPVIREFSRRTAVLHAIDEARRAVKTAEAGGPAIEAIRAFRAARQEMSRFELGRFLERSPELFRCETRLAAFY